jgi:hypothetical protein
VPHGVQLIRATVPFVAAQDKHTSPPEFKRNASGD